MPAHYFRKFERCFYSYQRPNRLFFTKKIDKCTYQEREKDPETGKEAFQLRLWDARIGRWLTTDPYGQFKSPYMAMGNNPINFIDPDGGFCYDAQGNQIPCPDGYCQYEGATMEHMNFLEEAVVTFSNKQKIIDSGDIYFEFTGDKVNNKLRVDGQFKMMMGGEELLSWSARSGSTSLYPTPNCEWELSNFHYRDGERANTQHKKTSSQYYWKNSAMTSADGIGFSVNITLEPKYGRKYLRVHPDGNLPGTRGCIGITCTGEDLQILENHLKFHTSGSSRAYFFMNNS
ncbi:hypothetical protein TPENAI_60790 [Tenacibaculum litopenaei]